ncbi:MAG TPA: glycosyltransferase N-terminal domain-containing protein, partial [Patescibacteria group bacterium]|nr:glycosyltransferase N-terminal domain-containing protein [Patescibacteria group bacterium]
MFFYNYIALPILKTVATVGGNFNKKIADRERNVRKSFKALEKIPYKTRRVWFHAASVGEFEQAKPVIEHLKALVPDVCIIVSFFSPSGFNTQKNYKFADAVLYMPLDTERNAREFVHLIKPDVAIFVRYEAWYNHLRELHLRGTPTFLICATLSQRDVWSYPFLKNIRTKTYSFFSKIYTVSTEQTERFKKLALSVPIETLTDTRFDRIVKIIDATRKEELIPEDFFKKNHFVLVAGSTWEGDENIILESFKSLSPESQRRIKLVLVPHEPTEEHIALLKTKLPDAVILSEISQTQ